ncbi:hypothetical protein ASE63_25745 [Bosea sp. Root381]|jgi:hypothetical protein|uniref:hypothetical protein n=1 Tax=Bosea sp. Root381 TaxID=1736524 RepID=UPI0006FF2EAB|nr:hypothetical protein [Bosea sp. Root381]KRE04322.1 hypothetical protein ASE63_25745 [Bosea sp. Root381]
MRDIFRHRDTIDDDIEGARRINIELGEADGELVATKEKRSSWLGSMLISFANADPLFPGSEADGEVTLTPLAVR